MSYFRNLDKSLLPDLFKPVEPEPEKQSGWRRAADVPLEFASGVARGVKFTADAFGAENAVSRGAGYVDDLARGLLSAQAQGEDQQIAQIMAEAQDKGVWEQVVAAAKAFAVAPGRMAVNALGTSVPAIGAALIPGVGQSGTVARLATLGGVGAVQGAGVVKGSIYEAVYEAHKQDGASEEEARAAAKQAQAYGGGNTDSIVAGAALGGAASATGAQPIIARALGRQAVDAAAKPGIARGVGRGILAETPLEAAQGGQEQLATNIALQREGADVPTFRGVAGSAALEGMAAAPIGGVAGGIEGAQAKRAAQRKAEADAALQEIGQAPDIDSAVDLFTKATDIPLLPAPTISVDGDGTAQTAAQRQRAAQEEAAARLERAGLRETGAQGQGRNSESTARDFSEWMAQTKAYPIQRAQEMAQIAEQRGIRLEIVPHSSGQGFTLVPAAWVAGQPRSQVSKNPNESELPPARIEPLPTPDVLDWLEDIPAGDAAEVLPTGEVIEEPDPVPTGEATDIEPEQADTELLLTGDGMPYGTRAGAFVRAKREGLPPDAVVEVPGGWAVKKESQGEPVQPDVPGTAGGAAGAAAGRAPDAVGSGVAVGRVAADAGGGQPAPAAGAVGRGGQVRAAGDGGQSDPALRIKALSEQWADAVARGDAAEARRINDLIVEAKKPKAAPEADAQDSRGLRESDRRARDVGGAAQELAAQIQGDIAENDFDADEVMPGLELFAKRANVPADDLRQEVLARIRKSGMKRGDIKRVERALDPTKRPAATATPTPAPAPIDTSPAPVEEPERGGQIAPAAGRDVMPEGLSVTFGGRTFKVESLNDAQAKWIEFRDRTGAGVSSIGNGVRVTDGAGRFVARISYNGRVWDSEDDGTVSGNVLAEAPEPPAPEVSTWTDASPSARAEFERGVAERPAIQWEDEQGQRLGLESISAGIGRAVGGLGDVVVSIKSAPGVLPLVAEVRAEYQGRLLESRGVEGDAAIKAAVDEYAEKIQQARERMAARVTADERGLPAEAPAALEAPAPTNPPAPPAQTRPERLIELRKRQSVLKQLLECLG